MSDILKKIEREALSLSHQERAFLADRLLSSLGGNGLNDIDIEWINEVERRYNEYKDGKRKGISAEKIYAEVNRILK
ncbi:MAG: addiction module protein [Desulfobacterales bacterium]|nr:addiction module protein [Desulfobacterales bacterium]